MVEIKTPGEIEAVRAAGQIVAQALAAALGLSLEQVASHCAAADGPDTARIRSA